MNFRRLLLGSLATVFFAAPSLAFAECDEEGKVRTREDCDKSMRERFERNRAEYESRRGNYEGERQSYPAKNETPPVFGPSPKGGPDGGFGGDSRGLTPARAFLSSPSIPPKDIGAYGVISFRAKATPSTRARLITICQSFVAHFPAQRLLPRSIGVNDQMLTIWPVENANAKQLDADDCAFAVDNYDLFAGQSAIADAAKQGGKFAGAGPYLVGWSPTNTRGQPGKLVLVVDLSKEETEASINTAFDFWQQRVIQDPALWRNGFSIERLRVSIREFVDKYGTNLVEVVKLSSFNSKK
jgi:hypothetical protein